MVTNTRLSLAYDRGALLDAMGQAKEHSTDSTLSALRRKAVSGRTAHQARAMSLAKALRLTLAKVADDLFDMPMAALGVKIEDRTSDALKDTFDNKSLLLLLDGGTGAAGAAMLDPLLVGALIQQQTMGRVMPEPGGDPRRMTDTDAAITATFMDTLLKRAALLPDTDTEKRLLTGYKFGSRCEDKRLLEMALEEPTYKVVTLTVDISGGVRQGQIVLCLPVPDRPDTRAPKDEDGGDDADVGHPAQPETLSNTVLALKIDLNVSLARLRMPLGRLSNLRPGDVLELGLAGFDKTEVTTLAGKSLGCGVLGQLNGRRALRMNQVSGAQDAPKRRMSDRSDLNQPMPSVHNRIGDVESAEQDPDFATAFDLPELPDLPDLPTFDLAEPDMPDFSDLPDLADLSERKTG